MFTDNVVLKTSVPGIEYCEETGKDRCFVFLRKLSKKKKKMARRHWEWHGACSLEVRLIFDSSN